MARVELAPEVLNDFDRLLGHMARFEVADAPARIGDIVQAIDILTQSPLIGRPVRARAEIIESVETVHRPPRVMLREGAPSMTCSADQREILDGAPPPAMTMRWRSAPTGAIIPWRALRGGKRELVIGRDARGYVALYRYVARVDTVFVLAIRNQRESGYRRQR